MSKKVELKLKRRKFVQSGQEEKAHEILKEYWALSSKNEFIEKVEEKEINIIPDVKKDIVEEKFNDIMDLVKIKGIGKETAKDIKNIYKNMSQLLKALKKGENIPLRNDVTKKLKKELI